MKRYKPSRIGLNPKWFYVYVIPPLIVITAVIVTGLFSISVYKNYKMEKDIQESIAESERAIQESIEESESYERYLDESIAIEQEERHEREIEENAKQRKQDIEYQNKILSNYWPKGTYVYDKERKIYGIIESCYFPSIITKEGWFFEITDMADGFKNPNIQQVGWKDWNDWTKKQIQNKKKSPEYRRKLKDIYEKEKSKNTAISKSMFPPNPKYGSCKYKDIYYHVIDWDGLYLKCRPAHKKDGQDIKYIYVYDAEKVDNWKKMYITNYKGD